MKPNQRKSRKNRMLMLIIALLIMCAAALCYIISIMHAGDREASEEAAAAEAEAQEAAETAEAAEEAEAETAEKAAQHVYYAPDGDDGYTIEAYDKAIEEGARYIVVPMVVSGDGTAYAAEDDHTLGMTGYDGYFSGMSDKQIENIHTKSGSPVLKVSDLFDKYGDSVTYLIDIRYVNQRNTDAFTILVRGKGYEENVIAMSSYFDALRPLDDAFPDMPKLYVSSDQATFSLALEKPYVDSLCASIDRLSEEQISAAHDSGKTCVAGSLSGEDDIKEAVELGVDAYFTDEAATAIELEKQYRND